MKKIDRVLIGAVCVAALSASSATASSLRFTATYTGTVVSSPPDTVALFGGIGGSLVAEHFTAVFDFAASYLPASSGAYFVPYSGPSGSGEYSIAGGANCYNSQGPLLS